MSSLQHLYLYVYNQQHESLKCVHLPMYLIVLCLNDSHCIGVSYSTTHVPLKILSDPVSKHPNLKIFLWGHAYRPPKYWRTLHARVQSTLMPVQLMIFKYFVTYSQPT